MGDMVKYEITNQTLNTITEFYKLHTYLYSIKDNVWFNKLFTQLERKACIAAVSIDSEIAPSDLLDLNKRNQIPRELLEDSEKYKIERRNINNLFTSQKDLNLKKFKEVHSALIGTANPLAGKLRTNKVALPKIINENGIYKKLDLTIKTAPIHIEKEITKFFEWLEAEFLTINPIILAGVSHYKIVKTHPFEEGNGRLARLYEKIILCLHEIDPKNILPTEEYYLLFRERYYDILERAIESEDLTEWLEFYTQVLLFSANKAVSKLFKISGGTIDIKNNSIIETTPKEKEVINILAAKKQASGAEIAREMHVTRQNTNTILKRLVDKKIVDKIGSGAGLRFVLKVYKQ